MGLGHRGACSVQGWGVEEHEGKKAPLSENKLLRKEDLGLTVTEMGSLGNGMDRSGRKDLPGRGKAVVETRVCLGPQGLTMSGALPRGRSAPYGGTGGAGN